MCSAGKPPSALQQVTSLCTAHVLTALAIGVFLAAEKFRPPEGEADAGWQVISDAAARAHGSTGHRHLSKQSVLEAKVLLQEQLQFDDSRPLTTDYIETFHSSPLLQVARSKG